MLLFPTELWVHPFLPAPEQPAAHPFAESHSGRRRAPPHLGLGCPPPLNFKGKLFPKWSALAWENLKQPQRGEVGRLVFQGACGFLRVCL